MEKPKNTTKNIKKTFKQETEIFIILGQIPLKDQVKVLMQGFWKLLVGFWPHSSMLRDRKISQEKCENTQSEIG